MSTFLQLANKLAQEAGVTGAAAAITAVANQTGQALQLVNWIKSAHTEIQSRHQNWRWMRSKFSVNTVVGDDSYASGDCTDTRLALPLTRFKRWLPFDDSGAGNVKRYLTSGGVSGEMWMTYLPWSYFQAIYKIGTQNNGPIVHFTIDPQNNLVIGPKPDAVYTVSGEYQMSALVLSADGDTPEFPFDFHDLVVYRAMEKYGLSNAAGEVLQRGQLEGTRLMRQLEADQLPELGLAGPLA